MRSAVTVLLGVLVGIAFQATTAWSNPEGHSSVTLRAYGLLAPSSFSSSSQTGTNWGWGGGIRWSISGNVALSLDASSVESGEDAIQPAVAGFVYGPSSASRVRPWIEGGGGYYRLLRGGYAVSTGLGSSGNPRDQFGRQAVNSFPHDAVGGYFGLGLDWKASSRLGLELGVRAQSWTEIGHSNWDGMVNLHSGLWLRLW